MEKYIRAGVEDARLIIFNWSFAKLVREYNDVLDDIMDDLIDTTENDEATSLSSSIEMSYETTVRNDTFEPHYSDDTTLVVSTCDDKAEIL